MIVMAFRSARELDDDDLELLDLATRTIDANTDANSPDADGIHTVGAAVMAGDYRTFAGVNLYHFTGGPCAELVALGAARAAGAREIVTIVAVGNGGRGILAPCGRDRQVLIDYYPGCRVLIPTPDGARSVLATDLLPGSFRGPEAVDGAEDHPELLFSARYLDAVRSGAKTRTTRLSREAEPGPVQLVFPTDPRTRLDATVLTVRQTTLTGLTAQDAQAEHCQSPAELRELLAQHYPNIGDGDQVWVHEFRLEP